MTVISLSAQQLENLSSLASDCALKVATIGDQSQSSRCSSAGV